MPLNLNEDSNAKKPQLNQSKYQPEQSNQPNKEGTAENILDESKEETKAVTEQMASTLLKKGHSTAQGALDLLKQKRQLNVMEIANEAEMLIDDELLVMDGLLEAMARVITRRPEVLKGLDIPFGGYFSGSTRRELPSVPSFASWHSTPEPSPSQQLQRPTLPSSPPDEKPQTVETTVTQ